MASSHDATSRRDRSQGLAPSCVPTLKTKQKSSWAKPVVAARGVTPRKSWLDVGHASQNPHPINGQNMRFSLAFL